MKAKVYVTLKKGVLDPQGNAVLGAAHSLDFGELTKVRVGKVFEIEVEEGDGRSQVEARLNKLADQLLANTVIENYKVIIEDSQ